MPFSAGSLPVRERGLKYRLSAVFTVGGAVAPRSGAWIEMLTQRHLYH